MQFNKLYLLKFNSFFGHFYKKLILFFKKYIYQISKMSLPVALEFENWEPASVRYMQPRVNDRGGKSISIISTQLNRLLYVSTPCMSTWGMSDYVNEAGESDGKFSMTLRFPNPDYETSSTKEFLKKMKDFEALVIEDAVKNSELWWGEETPREVLKHNFFPFITYAKDKVTKKNDMSKPPKMKVKVPNYNGKWSVEVYDPEQNCLFPNDDTEQTPVDFVPKNSEVKCLIQCAGIWIGGKGWGVTWKLMQCIVKPPAKLTVFGKCHISLSDNDKERIMNTQTTNDEETSVEDAVQEVVDTTVEDSEDEEEVVPEPVKEPVKKKRVVKKKATA